MLTDRSCFRRSFLLTTVVDFGECVAVVFVLKRGFFVFVLHQLRYCYELIAFALEPREQFFRCLDGWFVDGVHQDDLTIEIAKAFDL